MAAKRRKIVRKARPYDTGKKYELRKIDISSAAMTIGVVGVILGFIQGIFSSTNAFATTLGGSSAMAILNLTYGPLNIVIMPIVYGIIAYVFSAIVAFLYNVVARRVGGVRISLK